MTKIDNFLGNVIDPNIKLGLLKKLFPKRHGAYMIYRLFISVLKLEGNGKLLNLFYDMYIFMDSKCEKNMPPPPSPY